MIAPGRTSFGLTAMVRSFHGCLLNVSPSDGVRISTSEAAIVRVATSTAAGRHAPICETTKRESNGRTGRRNTRDSVLSQSILASPAALIPTHTGSGRRRSGGRIPGGLRTLSREPRRLRALGGLAGVNVAPCDVGPGVRVSGPGHKFLATRRQPASDARRDRTDRSPSVVGLHGRKPWSNRWSSISTSVPSSSKRLPRCRQ